MIQQSDLRESNSIKKKVSFQVVNGDESDREKAARHARFNERRKIRKNKGPKETVETLREKMGRMEDHDIFQDHMMAWLKKYGPQEPAHSLGSKAAFEDFKECLLKKAKDDRLLRKKAGQLADFCSPDDDASISSSFHMKSEQQRDLTGHNP